MNAENFNKLLLSFKNYYTHLHESDKIWTEASQRAREKEKDITLLSDQLRCLSRNQATLSPLEIQKTIDQVNLILEDKFSLLSSALESAINSQEELTSLRYSVEVNHEPLEDYYYDIVQKLLKNVYVSWLLLQVRCSTINAALKRVSFKSPDSIKLVFQCLFESDNSRSELSETLEIAESLLRGLELLSY